MAIASIEREMRGMRGDLREVIAALGALREDVGVLDGSVSGIRDATVSLEQQVAGLEDHLLTVGKSLRRIDSLVPRISRRSRLQAQADSSSYASPRATAASSERAKPTRRSAG